MAILPNMNPHKPFVCPVAFQDAGLTIELVASMPESNEPM